ncbi:MAG: protein translocase subunit SecD [Tumebacillaceae bacterium]
MVKWSRLLGFLLIVVLFFALAVPTYKNIWGGITLGLDLQGGFDVLYQVKDSPTDKVTMEGLKATKNAIEKRIDSNGIAEPNITIEGTDRIRVQIAGQFDQNEAKKMLVQTPKLEFKAPDGTVLATGADIKSNAQFVTDPQTGAPQVSIEFKEASKFADMTRTYVGQQIAIYLDDKLIQNPRVSEPILTGKGVIGQTDPKEARAMANYLNAGALPYPLQEISSYSVSPTLGDEALHMTLYAGLISFLLILVFMVVYYRIPGLIAMIALLMYAYLLFAVVHLMGITLTLPGLAALILGIGMAVDVNIIAIERMKDEFRQGKSLLSAVIMGQKRSMPTIIDANITSIIAGFIMYFMGTGQVASFAVAHIISVLATFLTAVLISRLLLQLFVRSNLVRNTWWYGAPRAVAKGGAKK